MVPLHSNRQRRPSSRHSGRVRRQLTPQERLETAAVRKAGACKECQAKKAKCRHTIHKSYLTPDTSDFSSSHHDPATELCKPWIQEPSISITQSASSDLLTQLPLWSVNLESMFSEHATPAMALASSTNEPMTYAIDSSFPEDTTAIPAFNLNEPATFSSYLVPKHSHGTLSLPWQQSQNFTINDSYNANIQSSSLSTPKDHDDIHSFFGPLLDPFDANQNFSDMGTLNDLPIAEEWMQHLTTGLVEAEPHPGQDDQVSYTELLFNSNDDLISPTDNNFL